VISARRAELTAALWLDDSRVLVGDAAGAVAVLDANTGKELATTTAGGPITSLAVDGDRIAFGALDGTLALADATLASVIRVQSPGPVTAIALAHGVLASGHDDGSTHTWNATTGAELASASDKEPLEEADDHDGHTSLAFSPDGSTLYASRPSGHTLVLAIKDLAQKSVLDGRMISTIEGNRVVAAAVDGTVLVHDLAKGTAQKLAGHHASVLAAAFSDDRQRLATASIDGTVRIWNLATGATTLVVNASSLGPATSVAFIGDLVAAGYASGALRLHPTDAVSARTRACWVLARFDRTTDVAPFCN
jgi:WD40 repeat protein